MKYRFPKSIGVVFGALAALVAAATDTQGGIVANPSFELNYNETWPHYGPIELWQGGNGVNDQSGPFHNTQTAIPDLTYVAFKQGNGTLGQEIAGLNPGQQYWLQFYYDARAGSQKVDIAASFNGVEFGKLVNVQPAYTKNVPYYFASMPFTPDIDAGTLLFTVTVTGDSTALFDGVTIVPRDTNNLTVANPSFEASGDVPNDGIITGGLAGWVGTGRYGVNKTDGTGLYADNGMPPDQDHVAVLNDASSIAQVIEGLTPGKPYQLVFAYNAKSGNSPRLQVKAGDQVLFEENVSPVGGSNPYRTKTVNFNATDFNVVITFAQTTSGDQTVLLDDIQLLGEAAQPLPPLQITPSVAEIGPGQKVTVMVTVPDVLLKVGDIDLKLRSLSPSVARLVGADSDGIASLHFEKNGASSLPLEVEGVARGSALLDVVDSAGLKVLDTLMTYVVTSLVKNPSFDSATAPAGVGYGEILGWTGGSGVNANGMPFLDNGLIPDRAQVGFLQGAKTLSQTITGLNAGESYWLQFFYNAREFGTDWKLNLTVKFAGQELAQINEITAVGAGNPFYFKNIAFKPTSESGLLEFITTVEGDATLLLDAVNIVQRDPVDAVVKNPSFEASGTIVGGVGYLTGNPLAGWEFQATGFGINVPGRDPFADNGVNPDQDAVVFVQNPGSFSQTITDLTPGKNYTILLWANPRNCCTGTIETGLRVSVDDVALLDEIIQPIGGSSPYAVKQVNFTAAGSEAVLRIEHVPEAGADRSLVVDNVRIVPQGQIPPIIMTQPQGSAQALKGDNVSLSVAAMGTEPLTYQWQLNGADLPGKTSPTLEINGITPEQSGAYAAVVKNSVGTKISRTAEVRVHEKVPGAFNTGVAANGSLLSPGDVDPHYVLVDNPNEPTSTKSYVVLYPPENWALGTETSQWIAPMADPQADPMPNVGFYKYRLSFDMTGYDPARAFITGSSAAAEGLDDIYLNDVVVPGYRRAGAAGSLADFEITSGFKPGVNTLDFRVFVTSQRQPSGVQVDNLTIGAQVMSQQAPSLSVAMDSGKVKISWPASVTGYSLQSATAVNGPYALDSATPAKEGDLWVVRIDPAGSGRFYRLTKAP